MRKRKKTCLNCRHSRIIEKENNNNIDVEEINNRRNRKIDCTNYKVNFQLIDRYKKNPYILPIICNHYQPKLIEKCFRCGESINQPASDWKYWVEDTFENKAVCSERCRKLLQKKLDRRTDNFGHNRSDVDYPF